LMKNYSHGWRRKSDGFACSQWRTLLRWCRCSSERTITGCRLFHYSSIRDLISGWLVNSRLGGLRCRQASRAGVSFPKPARKSPRVVSPCAMLGWSHQRTQIHLQIRLVFLQNACLDLSENLVAEAIL
jgi:hypothetical protein